MSDRIQRWPNSPTPHQSCIRCYRGGVETFFVVYGDVEWTAGALAAMVGIGVEEALATTEAMRAEHDARPEERHVAYIRLCARCAGRAPGKLRLYTQAEIDRAQTQGGELQGFIQTDEHMRRALGDG